jgi:hypothetical protein
MANKFNYMKRSYLSFISAILFACTVYSQQKTPLLLKSPADWGFERMDLPFDFAPGITYSGFEEIRFAPGMFDTTSANYFSYAFVVSINGIPLMNESRIKDFLDKYYKGLCISAGKEKKLAPDTSQVKAEVKTVNDRTGKNFSATVIFFDTFSNGRKITLFMEIEAIVQLNNDKTYMIVLVSSGKDNKDIWNKLREIKGNIILN